MAAGAPAERASDSDVQVIMACPWCAGLVPAAVVCPTCGSPIDVDELPRLIETARRVSVGGSLVELLDEGSPSASAFEEVIERERLRHEWRLLEEERTRLHDEGQRLTTEREGLEQRSHRLEDEGRGVAEERERLRAEAARVTEQERSSAPSRRGSPAVSRSSTEGRRSVGGHPGAP